MGDGSICSFSRRAFRFLNRLSDRKPLDFVGFQKLGRIHHNQQRLSSESVRKMVWMELFLASKSSKQRAMSLGLLRLNYWLIWARRSSRSKSRNEGTRFAGGARGTMLRRSAV